MLSPNTALPWLSLAGEHTGEGGAAEVCPAGHGQEVPEYTHQEPGDL